ncbi:MAG TPA: DUF3592 domain-containing protein [Candidatus Dormibacteraeota bacterium]
MRSRWSIITYLRRTPLLWIGAFLILPGLVFGAIGVGLAVQDLRFASGGTTAQGIVLSKDIKHATGSSGTSYSLRYRFTASNGRTYEGSSTIDVDGWDRLVERGPVTVQYLASDPSSSRLPSAGNLLFEVVFILIGSVALLIGGYLVVTSSRTLREDWRLLQVGIEAPATVAAVETTNLRINRRVQWEISYAYRDRSGKEYEGRSWTMSEGEARKFRPGDHGTIRYDPEQPGRSLWIH